MEHTRRPWTEQDDDLMMEMLSNEMRFREIAKRLNRTRNACIGRMHRLTQKVEDERYRLLRQVENEQKEQSASTFA